MIVYILLFFVRISKGEIGQDYCLETILWMNGVVIFLFSIFFTIFARILYLSCTLVCSMRVRRF